MVIGLPGLSPFYRDHLELASQVADLMCHGFCEQVPTPEGDLV